MNRTFTLLGAIASVALIFMLSSACYAQKLLDRTVSIRVNQKPVSEVLKAVSEQGKFYFSYNSNLIPGDSLVTLSVQFKSVKQVLDVLLTGVYQYKETGDYIIIQRPPKEKYFHLTGHILDHETGKEVDYASVYSKQQLASTLTDEQGFFKLRLRDRSFPLTLTVSKIGYADTSVVINSDQETDLNLLLYPKSIDLDPVFVRYSEGSGTWLGRLFVSSKLRLQSRNISRFFVSLPYQASFTPGLSTHGKMSSQVSNKFSLNVIGGYTAGVNGAEIAGVFNISKKDMRYVQVAGLFNVVSGHVHGVQMAGFYNQVLDSLKGVQVSGFGNQINKSLSGVQVSGVLGRVSGDMHGVQVSGLGNIAKSTIRGGQVGGVFNTAGASMDGFQVSGAMNFGRDVVDGVQVAGVGNISRKDVKGVQVAGLFNYAKNLHGVQFGVINIADSSSGYSIGLINIVKKGKGVITLYANEVLPVNLAWKSGNHKLYSIFTIGTALNPNNKAYTFGFGLGKDVTLNKTLSLSAELLSQNFYLGHWENLPVLNRLQTALNVRLTNRLSVFAGPSFSAYYSEYKEFKKGYQSFSDKGFSRFKLNNTTNAWIGWQFGLSWNYKSVYR
ncbi:STN and carboxypeptidase regulatory-like domain-containing protein [Dyadobacter sp. LHD-138]|uniref:STN and carboxypeptidase regulatory-like domain-containing protein n=1 Tax=Dyadobacter sp. LHD-138 TaxID=3071413 RepID=UPI0027DEEFE3|nr:STN and carboxypeptidase regulatory-like domain-containing protein [Dyadobacter sp. LHD-138]MDQ6476958.1 STN and carboxypeptidase regulatory-like domain-containing protein [Dyadobacter sp. LHD-138]